MAKPKVRYAVVGQGHFAQKAVLPAFKHAKNSVLTALVSSDPKKLRKLAKAYDVEHTVDYDGLDSLCREDAIDAVYIVTPNHTHRAFTERVAPHGIHVLCEKPMAVTEEDCEAMIRVCADNGCKLMIAYRLHFEEGNLSAVDLVQRGKLGEPRFFNSTFSFQVHEDNIRVGARSDGGGPLYDIGAYCINAARYLFREEPVEVIGMAARRPDDERFTKVEEQASAVLRFPRERLATFTVSFGAAATGFYEVVGEKGVLCMDPAYAYDEPLEQEVVVGNKKPKAKKFKTRDQIGPEISYFSDCILNGHDPEPSGKEGLADVRVIRAIYRSIDEGRPIRLDGFDKALRPGIEQERSAPPQRSEPPLINVQPET
jgi:glucose-fructose oxidoreductase